MRWQLAYLSDWLRAGHAATNLICSSNQQAAFTGRLLSCLFEGGTIVAGEVELATGPDESDGIVEEALETDDGRQQVRVDHGVDLGREGIEGAVIDAVDEEEEGKETLVPPTPDGAPNIGGLKKSVDAILDDGHAGEEKATDDSFHIGAEDKADPGDDGGKKEPEAAPVGGAGALEEAMAGFKFFLNSGVTKEYLHGFGAARFTQELLQGFFRDVDQLGHGFRMTGFFIFGKGGGCLALGSF